MPPLAGASPGRRPRPSPAREHSPPPLPVPCHRSHRRIFPPVPAVLTLLPPRATRTGGCRRAPSRRAPLVALPPTLLGGLRMDRAPCRAWSGRRYSMHELAHGRSPPPGPCALRVGEAASLAVHDVSPPQGRQEAFQPCCAKEEAAFEMRSSKRVSGAALCRAGFASLPMPRPGTSHSPRQSWRRLHSTAAAEGCKAASAARLCLGQ